MGNNATNACALTDIPLIKVYQRRPGQARLEHISPGFQYSVWVANASDFCSSCQGIGTEQGGEQQ
jgi:hypothetical protein